MVRRAQRLRCDGEGRVYRGRGRKKRGIDTEEIVDIVGSAPGIEHRSLRVGTEDGRAALVRGIEDTQRDSGDVPGSNFAEQAPGHGDELAVCRRVGHLPLKLNAPVAW